MGQLHCLIAIQSALIDVERTVLFGQIPKTIALAVPHRVAVLALERRQFREFTIVVEPDVTCDGGSMMFPPRVLIAFLVVIEDLSFGVEAHVFHGDVGELHRS